MIFFLLFLSLLKSQSDTLNKFNSKGKRNGYWIKYLDDKTNPTDSINSFFYGYELYDNGKKVFTFNHNKDKIANTFKFIGTIPSKGNPIKINGIFKWYYLYNGALVLSLEESYKNGSPVIFKSFSSKLKDTAVYLFEYVDFTKRYNNIPGTNYNEIHNSYDDHVQKYWYYKKKRRWTSHKIK